MSIALAIKKRAKLCRVFCCKKSEATKPPIAPARSGMYFLFSSDMILRSKQSMVLKIKTKDPTNKPKLIESLFLISFIN